MLLLPTRRVSDSARMALSSSSLFSLGFTLGLAASNQNNLRCAGEIISVYE